MSQAMSEIWDGNCHPGQIEYNDWRSFSFPAKLFVNLDI
jgi:hypothetical protein